MVSPSSEILNKLSDILFYTNLKSKTSLLKIDLIENKEFEIEHVNLMRFSREAIHSNIFFWDAK